MDQFNETDVGRLKLVVELLSESLQGRADRCILETDGARDEAMLVGTDAGILGLATVLIRLVLASRGADLDRLDCFEDQVAGEDVVVTNEIKHSLREESDVWVVAACLVRDGSALERLVEKLRANQTTLRR